ncbi:MAG: aminoacyl-tRNA hydrolase [Candidatus Omnitrophota bacterium]
MFFSNISRRKTVEKLIIGLGNPDSGYRFTRHNAGAWAVKIFAQKHKLVFKNSRSFKSLIARGKIEGHDIALILPQTYMNLCGEAVAAYFKKHNTLFKNILVVYDDVALPLGDVRFKGQGSAGGHNGLVSVINRLSTQDFARLKIGIDGADCENLSDYVLAKFCEDEKKVLEEALNRSAEAMRVWILEGVDKAMNYYNKKENKEGKILGERS